MLRVCYCGTVATKYRRDYVVAKACEFVARFEAVRRLKVDEIKVAPLLRTEFLRWREVVEERQGPVIRDDSDEIAARLVDLRNVDAFLAEAWGYAISGNRWTGYTLHRLGTRAEVLGRLVALLRRRIEALPDA